MNCKDCKHWDIENNHFGLKAINKRRNIIGHEIIAPCPVLTSKVVILDSIGIKSGDSLRVKADFGCKHFEAKEPFKSKF